MARLVGTSRLVTLAIVMDSLRPGYALIPHLAVTPIPVKSAAHRRNAFRETGLSARFHVSRALGHSAPQVGHPFQTGTRRGPEGGGKPRSNIPTMAWNVILAKVLLGGVPV